MGVRGLKTFIERNDDLFIKDYQLHDTNLVIDSSNLVGELIYEARRLDQPGSFDRSKFEASIITLFDSLKNCNINPLFVFDGAQPGQETRLEPPIKLKRSKRRNSSAKLSGDENKVRAAKRACEILKSLATQESMIVEQIDKQADSHIALLARKLQCPILSNDSDFYLYNLPYGILPHEQFFPIKLGESPETIKANEPRKFISCWMYNQNKFIEFFPDLSLDNLPLLGVLAGNDYVNYRIFENICSHLPSKRIHQECGVNNSKQFRRLMGKSHEKIIKILYFLCDKTLDEAIKQLVSRLPSQERVKWKKFIRGNLKFYEVAEIEDDPLVEAIERLKL